LLRHGAGKKDDLDKVAREDNCRSIDLDLDLYKVEHHFHVDAATL
jgi:hypothetical protein